MRRRGGVNRCRSRVGRRGYAKGDALESTSLPDLNSAMHDQSKSQSRLCPHTKRHSCSYPQVRPATRYNPLKPAQKTSCLIWDRGASPSMFRPGRWARPGQRGGQNMYHPYFVGRGWVGGEKCRPGRWARLGLEDN